MVGGFLVISFFISKRAVFGGRNQPHVTQLTGMSALLAGSYGASTVWFLRSYLRTICLKYAEFALVRVSLRTSSPIQSILLKNNTYSETLPILHYVSVTNTN